MKKKDKQPTSIDLAKLANVSQATVSRAFYPNSSMSPELRNRILRKAKEIGFSPNAMARALVSKKSRIIGLVVAYLDNLFYPYVLEAMATELQKLGYQMMIFMGNEVEDPKLFLSRILPYGLDGIIMASTLPSSGLSDACHEHGIPVLMFNRYKENDFSHVVISDNYEGSRKVADFLARGGHKKMAYIAGAENTSTNTERVRGFADGLANHGLKIFRQEVGGYDFEVAKNAARDLFSNKRKGFPDAVFVANDHMAFAVMDVLRNELGLSIPDDVSVVGYDNVPPASWEAYNLTTVEQPYLKMSEIAAHTIVKQIEEKENKHRQKIILSGDLIVRKSARLPDESKQ